MDWLIGNAVNALTLGLLLFLLSSGLTLAFSLMGVLSFAHGALYALGAYLGWQIAQAAPDAGTGFVLALLVAPVLVGLIGLAIERLVLQRVRPRGHLPELLATCGVGYVISEAIPWIWGRNALADYVPGVLANSIVMVLGAQVPGMRIASAAISLLVLATFALLLRYTRLGLILRAALTHPQMVEALGVRLSRLHGAVFAFSCALAGLAGVLGGNLFVIDPGMANSMVGLGFVIIVIGGLGSVRGAFIASLLVGAILVFGAASSGQLFGVALARIAPALPYAAMVLALAVRPTGLLGRRE